MERMAGMWTKGISHLPLDQVSPKHAIGRRAALLLKGKSHATCNRETSFLKAILNRAVEQNRRTRIAQGNEDQRLREVMMQEDFDVVEMAIQTGIRRGVLLSLPWKQIDLDTGWIDIQHAKGDTSRQVPMTKRVREILERRHATRRSLWVFPNKSGKNHVQENNWHNRVWRPALEEAGIEGLTIHDLRRSFASRMATAGKGGRELTGILGHTTSRTTDRYAHLDPNTLEAAIQVLDETEGQTGLRVVK